MELKCLTPYYDNNLTMEVRSTAQMQEQFHPQFGVWVIFIAEVYTVTVKCRTVIKACFLYFNVYLSVMLDSQSCSFTSISFLINTQALCKAFA